MSNYHFDKFFDSSSNMVYNISSKIKEEYQNKYSSSPVFQYSINSKCDIGQFRKYISSNLEDCRKIKSNNNVISRELNNTNTVSNIEVQKTYNDVNKATSKSTNDFSKKKKRTYVYGKSDTQNAEENNKPSSDFKSALSKYEEDLIKEGKTSTLDNSKVNKKRKNGFVSPFIKEDEEDSSIKKKKKNEDILEIKGIDPEIAERIQNEILETNLNVRWDDIAGLEDVKKTLYEIIILPNQHPEMFTGLRAPPKGLLLFGPPGNGKTMIAKAIASEANLTFFSISASILCSKWIGEGEKTVRALFAVARAKQPSFIFIDEIDSILSSRSSEEHESSRRLKNEFLLQFEGATTSPNERVTVMGATNRPYDIDDAARRRLSKRIYVPLPGKETRRNLLNNLLKNENHCLSENDFDMISEKLEGYSCNDIQQVCQYAAMGPIRDRVNSGELDKINILRAIDVQDFQKALDNIRPSVAPETCKLYEEFSNKFGTKGF